MPPSTARHCPWQQQERKKPNRARQRQTARRSSVFFFFRKINLGGRNLLDDPPDLEENFSDEGIELNEIKNTSPDEDGGRQEQREEILDNPVAPCDENLEEIEVSDEETDADEEMAVAEIRELVQSLEVPADVMDNQSFASEETDKDEKIEEIYQLFLESLNLPANVVDKTLSYASKKPKLNRNKKRRQWKRPEQDLGLLLQVEEGEPLVASDDMSSYAGEPELNRNKRRQRGKQELYEQAIITDFIDDFLGMESGQYVEAVNLDLTDAQEEENPPSGNIYDEDALFGHSSAQASNQTLADQFSEEKIQNDSKNIVEQTEDGFAAPAPAVEHPEDLFENLIHNKLREPGADEDWDDPEPIKLRLLPGTMQYVVVEIETPPIVQEEESNKGKKKKKKKKKKRVEEEEVSPDVLQEEFGDSVSNVVISLMASGELQVTKTIVPVPAGPQNISGKKIILEEQPVEVSQIEGQETIITIDQNQDVSPPNVLIDNPQEENIAFEDDLNKEPAAVEQQENPIDKDPIVVEVAEKLSKLFDEQVKESSAEKLPDVQTVQKIVPVAEEKVPDEAQTKKGKKKNKKEKELIPKAEVGKNKEILRKEKEKVLEEQGHAIDITAHFYKFNFEEGVEKVSHFPLNQKEKEADEWECPAPVSLHYVPKVKRFLDLEEHQKNKKVEIIEEVVEEPKILPDVTNSKKNEPEKTKSPSKSEKFIVKLPTNVVDSKKEEKSVVVRILKRPIEGPSAQGDSRAPVEQKKDKNDSVSLKNIPKKEVGIPEKTKSVEKPAPAQLPPESVVKRVQPAPIVENKVFKPAIVGPSAQGESRAPAEEKRDKNNTDNLENIPRKPVLFSEKVKSGRQPPSEPSAQGEFRASVEQKKDKNDTDKIKIIAGKVPIPEKIISAEKPPPVLFPPESVVESARPDPIVIEKEVVQPAIERPPAQGGSRAPAEQKRDKKDTDKLKIIPGKEVRVPEKTKSVEKPAAVQLPPETVNPIVEKTVVKPEIESPSAQGESRAPEEQKKDMNKRVHFEQTPRKAPFSEKSKLPRLVKKPAPAQLPPESVVESVQPAPIVEKKVLKPSRKGRSAQGAFRVPEEQKRDNISFKNIPGNAVPIPEKIKPPPVQFPPEPIDESYQYEELNDVWTALRNLRRSQERLEGTLQERFNRLEKSIADLRVGGQSSVIKKPNRLPMATVEALETVSVLFYYRETEQYEEMVSYLQCVMNATQSWQAAVDALLEALFSPELQITIYFKKGILNFLPEMCPSIEKGLWDLLKTHRNGDEMTWADFKNRVNTSFTIRQHKKYIYFT
ncbi:Hypothetical predicted protein [Cloeon dipterum]|uniref:Uncharacterized protein n=1 Tax=Cloeon dipterum TaxID=197152 RepID=A0A8S1BX81_9INSE|nr:Hypothetical predicted protein [Cloeon dipterum]